MGVYVANDGVLQSFLLENGRFMTIEVPFPDSIFTDVSGINNRGQIVGRYQVLESNTFFSHGFIATPKSETRSESQLLASKPNDSSNFKLSPQDVEEASKRFSKWARPLK